MCGDCNSEFSAIDKQFVDGVEFYYTGENVLRTLGLGRTVLNDGTSINVRYRRDGFGEFAPQLYEHSATEWRFFGHRESDRDAMFRELSTPTNLSIKSELVVQDDGVPRLAIIRSAPNAYLIQGTDAEVLARFCEQTKAAGFMPEWIGETRLSVVENPTIRYNKALSLEPFCRAMAKIALNFVCYRLGPQIALREEFDGVRSYARTGEGSFVDYAVPALLNHQIKDSHAPFANAEHHTLFLVVGGQGDARAEAVLITIRGKTIGRLDLTKGRPGLPPGSWLLTRFHEDRRSLEDFTLPDDMPRALLNPEALGLEDIWPFRSRKD